MTRKTQTILFTDVVGSTELRTTQGDDAGDDAVASHDRIARVSVDGHGGTIVKGTGDGCLAMFPSARAAVMAAVDIQQATTRLPPGAPQVRIGINAGEVREVDGDVFGEAVNAAARIAALAGTGEIFVSRVVRDLLGTTQNLALTNLGEVALKGFPSPWELFRVDAIAAPIPTHVEVRLLGEVAVTVDGEPVPAFAAPRLQQLLARLVLAAGNPQSRARLAFELWPDSDERQARTNLRKLLHELRASMPDADRFLDVDSHTVRWRPDCAAVDVVTFLDAIGAGDFETAASAYGGDLLPGCYDDWLLDERERLRSTALDALRRLANDAVERGDDDTTIRVARRVVQLDALDELGYRLLMQALARRGERAEALRAYHRCVEALRRDLGVDPEAATREVYEAIRRGPLAAEALPVSSPVSDLVGRDHEVAVAVGVWARAVSGQAGVLLVTGEAGIGKSRLVEELGRHAAAEGHGVARTRAYEAAGRFPWGPVVELLRSDTVRPTLARLESVWLAELVRLLPELRDEHPDLPEPPALHDEARRQRLFEAVVRGLLASARPLLLVVDDVQWCDPDTVELLGFLVRRAPNAPVLVAATARTEEMGDTSTLPTLLSELLHDGTLHELPLPRLDPAATAELAARLGGGKLDEDAVTRLWQETEGNALFVVEAVRSGLTGETSVTPTVQALIRSRLSQLSSDARYLAEVAGTIGREFTVEELAAATARDEDDLVDALDELWRRQIVRERGTGYDFSHDKLREVAHAEISPARRRRLQRAVADGLAALHGTAPGPVSARLAVHYEAAGLVDEAVEAYRAAAAHAVELFSLDDAIAALRHALRLLERLPAGMARDDREVAIRIALGAPTAAREGYNSSAARELYERAYALCRRLGGRVDPAVLRGLGLAELVAGRFERSNSFGEALLEESGDLIAVTEGHYLIGVSAFWCGDLARSEEHLRRALASYRAEHATDHMTRFAQDPKAVCLVRLAWTMLWRGDTEAARGLVAEAKSHTLALEHPASLAYVFLYAALLGLELGDVDAPAADIEFSDRLWHRQTLRYFMALSRLLTAWLAHVRGDAPAPGAVEEILDGWRQEGQHLHLTYGLALLARIRLDQREPEAAREAVREGLDRTATCNQRYLEPELLRLEGELLRLEGDDVAAEACFQQSLALAEAQGAIWLRDRTLASLESAAPRSTRR